MMADLPTRTAVPAEFGGDPNADWAAHKNAAAGREAAMERAAYEAEMREERAAGIGAGPVENKATEPQAKFLRALLNDRQMNPKDGRSGDERAAAALAALDAEQITKATASRMISALKELPFKPRDRASDNEAALTPTGATGKIRVEYEEVTLDDGKQHRVGRVEVPGIGRVLRGRYALDTSELPSFMNDTSFFHVWVGSRGGWKVFVQASDDEFELEWPTKREIIALIAKDPEAAMRLYGRELGKCGACGRTLTNDESRELGIGPVCRTRL